MYLNSLLLLGTAATFTLAADPAIKFCPETDSDTNCAVEVMEFGVCKWVPGSNAKGDNGSQVTLLNLSNYGDISCTLYTADDLTCKGPNSTPIYNTFKMHDQGKTIYRSYMCKKK